MGDDEEELSFEEMINLSNDEVDALLSEYDTFKEERRKFQESAFLKLPPNPPLVLDCIQYLRVNGGVDTEGIFRVNGDSNAVEKIKTMYLRNLDLNDPLLSVQQELHLKNYDVATALKSYFRLLEEPLVPHQNYQRIKAAMEDPVKSQNPVEHIHQELLHIPEPNKSVLAYTMLFFQDIIQNQDINKMSANNMATCLTMSITRFLETGNGKNHFAAMLEVGLSTKIISLMLTSIDFAEFIHPRRYFEMLKATKYKEESTPSNMEEFMDGILFKRFKERYEEELRREMGPPPVPRRGKRKNKYFF